MEAVTNFKGDALPKENDLTACLKCGALYMRHNKERTPITDEELSSLPERVLRVLARFEAARQLVVECDPDRRSAKPQKTKI